MTVMGNIGGAMSMASTGLVVMGAAVPLGILKSFKDDMEEPPKQTRKPKVKKMAKKTTKKSKRK